MSHAVAVNDDARRQMADTVHAYVRALNAGDLDAVMALYAEDASTEDPVGSPARVGRAAIRDSYAVAMASMQLAVALDGELYFSERACAAPFIVDISREGHTTTIRSIDVFEFDAAGRIARMRAYFDASNLHD